MPTLYIETSIVSYLRQRPSPQVIAAARQLLTRQWWDEERKTYELVTSQYVLDEAAAGDPVLAAERLESLDGIPLLPLDAQIGVIANEIMSRAILPPRALIDALHIAAVAHHKVQYLLTWNCTHIANAKILPRIRDVLTALGCPIPILCTPEEMVNDDPKISKRDTTIEDIHRERQRMAEKFGGDITAILADARQRQAASGRVVWQGQSPATVQQPTGPDPAVSGKLPPQHVGSAVGL